MPYIHEKTRLGDVLKFEANNRYSRYETIVAQGQKLNLGQLIGQRSTDKVEVKPQESNTGNGEVKELTLGPQARRGTYALIAESKDTFSLTTPHGLLLPLITVGTPYKSLHLNLTVTAGNTEFAANDVFLIHVDGSHKIAAFDPLAVDGSQIPVGIVITDIDASDADTKAVIINRDAIFSDKGLIWPKEITEPQKLDATTHLNDRGIIIRHGV